MASSKSVVLAALIANGAIAIMKFVGFLLTGSSAMLSETYHSISDTGNQVFLLVGIRYGKREADRQHPFGYGKAQFFYSFLVSVALFGIAGWASATHGWSALTSAGHGEAAGRTVEFLWISYTPPAWLEPIWVNYTVLAGAFVFESWALYKANQGLSRQIEERGWSGYREAFRKTSDVTTLTAFTEDTIALTGIALAFVGILLEQLTGDALYDALASILIGLLLMGFAVALAIENKRLLLGESIPKDRERELRDRVRDVDEVAELVGLRTVYFGPGDVVVMLDVALVSGLNTSDVDRVVDEIENRLREADPDVSTVYVEPELDGDRRATHG